MKQKYLTVSDISNITSLAPSTLYSHIRYKAIPHIRLFGRIVFEEQAIKKWVAKRAVKENKSK